MDFITRYRRALWEIKNGLSNAETEGELRQLLSKEEAEIRGAIRSSREVGRGAIHKNLRDYVSEERYAWSLTQYLKDNAGQMDVSARQQEAWVDFVCEIYYVSNDAIGGMLELLVDYYPDELFRSVAAFSGSVPIPELINKFGSVPAKKIIKSKTILLSTEGGQTRAFSAKRADKLLAYQQKNNLSNWKLADVNANATPTKRPTFSVNDIEKHIGCRCYRQEEADHVEELCPECPIVVMLNDPQVTAHVRAEMRQLKELKLPEQYRAYCIERLDHHAALAAQFANEMNRPGGWSHTRMELKFYNAAVAKLYRDELTPGQEVSPTEEDTLLEKFRQYLPGFLSGRATTGAANAQILTDWTFEVRGWSESWDILWLQQQNYERLLDSHHDPTAFLDGLESLLALLEPSLLSDTKAKKLLGHVRDVATLIRIKRRQDGEPQEQVHDPYINIEKVRREACAGMANLRKWITQRRQPTQLQLLDVLRTVQFVDSNRQDNYSTVQLTVALLPQKDFQEYFSILKRRFEGNLPNRNILRALLRQLRVLMDLPLQRLINHEQEAERGAFHLSHLPTRYSNWHFPGLVDRHVIHAHSLTSQLWQEVVWAFYQRIRSAWQLYNDVAALLGEPVAPDPLPRETLSAGDTLCDDTEAMEQLQAYLARLPVFLNAAHQFDLPVTCGGYDDQDEEFRPLLRAFSTALLRNPPKKSQRRQILGEMLNIINISTDSTKRKRALYEAGNYSLHFLAADYPMFRFGEVEQTPASQAAPLFWSFFTSWVHYRKLFAQEVYNLLADSLGKPRLANEDASVANTQVNGAAPSAPLPRIRASKQKTAQLRGLTVDAVKTIFAEAGLGPTNQAGEWAAGLIALTVSGCLVGVPPEIDRWFIECHFAGKTGRKTIDNRKQWTEPEQFATPSEGVIFKSVLRKANKLKTC